jgi:formamidopyrimidine-DNA glycosylase
LPFTAGRRLTKPQVERLLRAAREVLEEAIELGGSTIDSFESGGVSGRFQNEFRVYNQSTCRACQPPSPIVKITLDQRGTYYCPRCQK